MITCMKMKSFVLKYVSKIMFYDVNIACYHGATFFQHHIICHVSTR